MFKNIDRKETLGKVRLALALFAFFIVVTMIHFCYCLREAKIVDAAPMIDSTSIENGYYHIDDYIVLNETVYESRNIVKGIQLCEPITIISNGNYYYTYLETVHSPTADRIKRSLGDGIIVKTAGTPEEDEKYREWAKENNIPEEQILNHGVDIILDRLYRDRRTEKSGRLY